MFIQDHIQYVDDWVQQEIDEQYRIARDYLDLDNTVLSFYRSFVQILNMHMIGSMLDTDLKDSESSKLSHARLAEKEIRAAAKMHGFVDVETAYDMAESIDHEVSLKQEETHA